MPAYHNHNTPSDLKSSRLSPQRYDSVILYCILTDSCVPGSLLRTIIRVITIQRAASRRHKNMTLGTQGPRCQNISTSLSSVSA